MLHALRGCFRAAILTVGMQGVATAVHSDLERHTVSAGLLEYSTSQFYPAPQCIYLEVATRTPIKPKPIS